MAWAQTEFSGTFAFTPTEMSAFRQNGFAGPFKIYEPEEMQRAWSSVRRQALDRRLAIYPDDRSKSGATNIANYDRHFDIPFLARHICRPEIVDRVRCILGPDLLCWRTEFFPKYPGDEATDWHQADTFANASGSPQILWPNGSDYGGTITAWTAFTEATENNGCLRFIPGTQETMFYDETKGMKYDASRIGNVEKEGTRSGFFGYDYRDLQIDPDWHPDESKAVSMVMRPGECVLFWSTLMHSSFPHRGLGHPMRLGFVARYVPTCVRVYPDTEVVEEYGGRIPLTDYGAVVVAGRDGYGHNRLADTDRRGEPFRRLE